ncbi:hypothetical protein QFC22_000376 [Naganishia vaughanmartiniae]|uniref:Uncharacterized protein n=1 Tax=Naganishia vaughanmartiniae TaxID=1424756 RepID=A0ACC2XPY7_9TREE|nr:hypothetical protein QFC22_000376 [Naganishia vaughanmartiniae]
MWIMQIRDLQVPGVYKAEKYEEKSLPLKQSKIYYIGRSLDRSVDKSITGPTNDIIMKHVKVTKGWAHLKVEEWQRYVDTKTGEIMRPTLTLFIDNLKGSATTVSVWQPMNANREDSYDETDYMSSSEGGEIDVQSGTVIHVADDLKIRFVWKPVIVADSNRTPDRATQYTYLNQYLIYNSLVYVPDRTSFVVRKEIYADDQDCLLALSDAVPIVSPEWLDATGSILLAFEGRTKPEGIFRLPAADQFLPALDSKIDDIRKKASWWLPKEARGGMWKGKTVLTLSGKSPLDEEKYFHHLGARVRHLDIVSQSNRVTNWDDFAMRLKPYFTEAEKNFEECLKEDSERRDSQDGQTAQGKYVAIALGDTVLESYNATGEMLMDILTEPLEKFVIRSFCGWFLKDSLDIPINFAQNWWITLTRANWKDFSSNAQDENDTVMDSQSHSALAGGKSQLRASSQSGKSVEQLSVGIPSTHPEEQAPAEQLGQKRPLRLRAKQGRQFFSALENNSNNENDDGDAEMPQRKRSRLDAEEERVEKGNTLAHDSAEGGVSDTQKANASSGSGLRRRVGKTRLGLLHSIGENDDDSTKPHSNKKDSLHAYRGLYNSVKQSGINPSQVDEDDDRTEPQEEEDFVQRSINRQKKETETTSQMQSKANKRQEPAANHEMDIDRTGPSKAAEPSNATARKLLHAQHIDPTRPEAVTKDTEFLQTVTKARKGAKNLDEFDLEFNALKIARPKKSAPVKVYGAGLFDASRIYNSVLDLDTDVTGNFIKIERVNLFRKDKSKDQDRAANQDWGGRPNFKKFKKQVISRRSPVKLNLAPAADFGIGLDYWPDKKTADTSSTELPHYTQTRIKQSQASMQADHTSSQLTTRPRKRLLRVDSDDENDVMALPTLARDATGAFITQLNHRTNKLTTSVGSTSATGSRQSTAAARSRVAPDQSSPSLLAVQSDEDEQPVRKTYQKKVSKPPRGESSQAEDFMGSAVSSHTASTTPSTNKRKRLIPMDDDEDNDLVNTLRSFYPERRH